MTRNHLIRGYYEHIGGYYEYGRECSVHRGDTMSTLGDITIHLGELFDKSFSKFILKTLMC